MKTKQKKTTVITLGCSKNLIDSENIITHLNKGGYDAKHEKGDLDTDTVIINTCGFIHDAKQESINTILDFVDLKNKGEIKNLFVTGCLSQRYKEDLKKEMPEVDGYFGTRIGDILARFNVDYKKNLLGERQPTTPPHYAYLKIAEGCSRSCAFCAIPLMRGKHKSREMEGLIEEAKNLAKKGVKEIILISQELTYYGLDIYDKRSLPQLLDELVKIDGIEWIRMHYTYPGKFPMELIDTMSKHEKVCNYLDMPLQHTSDDVLKRMKRFATKKDAIDIIKYARKKIPNIAIRTTFIVGFPGETADNFEELLDFIRDMQFDRVGVFEYSHEEGTSGYLLEDDVSDEEKSYRANTLMEVQREISNEKNYQKVGDQIRVLIDRKEGDLFVGRTQYDSPEVDNEVLVNFSEDIMVGDFVLVNINRAEDYDLYGDVVS